MCNDCWFRDHVAEPARIKGDYTELERCCWCGKQTASGIYVREDPAELPKHEDHDD